MIVVGNEEGVLWIDKLHCFSEEGTSTHLFSFMREIHHLITFSTCAKDISHTNWKNAQYSIGTCEKPFYLGKKKNFTEYVELTKNIFLHCPFSENVGNIYR